MHRCSPSTAAHADTKPPSRWAPSAPVERIGTFPKRNTVPGAACGGASRTVNAGMRLASCRQPSECLSLAPLSLPQLVGWAHWRRMARRRQWRSGEGRG